jgi:hypothetical protein
MLKTASLALCLLFSVVSTTTSTSLTPQTSDGICVLYADDNTRSFYFSGVTSSGALHPQLLNLPSWDAVLLGLDSGEDEDTMYIVPQGVGSSDNMTIATVRTQAAGAATVSYAALGQVPGFEGIAPFTYMPVMHLDAKRGQMIAALQGMSGPPPAAGSPLRDPGDLFLVIADVFPSNGSVSKVWLDLTEQDARWGGGVISGVSAFDGASFWLNPIGGNVPSEQALYGFPLNGSAATVVPYGAQLNLAHLFFSEVQNGLLAVLDNGSGQPLLARFSPPSPDFKTLFTWNLTAGEQSWGLYDVSPDGSKFLSVLVDKDGESPVLSIVDLALLKEVKRTAIQGFHSSDTLCDVNWCNVD